MKTLLIALLSLTAAPAFAGQQYCSDDADTYYVEKVPFGYAVVRGGYADFCKRDHMSDNPAYICDGDASYKMGFDAKGSDLNVTMPSGEKVRFEACTFEHAAAE